MATNLNKSVVRETEFSFEGQPVVVTLNPDLTLEIGVKRCSTTKLKINLAEQYLTSRHMDGKQGRSRRQFALRGKEIVVVAKPASANSDTTDTQPGTIIPNEPAA